MNRWLDHIQIWCCGSLFISDNLINFWEKNIKSKMTDRKYFEKTGRPKSLWARYLMKRWLDRIQIWRGGSLGISDDLINFWEESIKNKMANGRHFEKIATRRACGRDILWTIGWIAFKFYAVVLSPCPIRLDRQTTSLSLTTGAPYTSNFFLLLKNIFQPLK